MNRKYTTDKIVDALMAIPDFDENKYDLGKVIGLCANKITKFSDITKEVAFIYKLK